ncbi:MULTISPECIES: hypothetical protein [unclassified Brevundimonas]
MTHRQDDTSAPARGADILPFRRPATPPVSSPEPAPHGDDSDDDGPSAA